MLFLATTKMRQMKIAEPSMLTAHTRGSARSVFLRHRRVVAAPMTTPNRPVTQVIAPKIRLNRRAETRGNNYYVKYISCKFLVSARIFGLKNKHDLLQHLNTSKNK